MNEEVLKDLYNRAVSEGYTKDINEFTTLLYTNNDVFNDMYEYVKGEGYQKSIAEFGVLVGKTSEPTVKKKEVTIASATTDLQTSSNPSAMEAIGDKIEQIDPLSQHNLNKEQSISNAYKAAENPPSEEKKEGNFLTKAASLIFKGLLFQKEIEGQVESGTSKLVSGALGVPEIAWDVASSAPRALGIPVQHWRDTPWVQSADVAGVELNPIAHMENTKNYLFERGKEIDKYVRTINPELDKGALTAFSEGDVGLGFRNLISGTAQSLPTTVAIAASGGAASPAMVGMQVGTFAEQSYQQSLDDNDYEKIGQDRLALVSLLSGSMEYTFESVLGAGATGAAIRKLIEREGKDVAEGVVRKGIKNGFVDMLITNPWLAPLGDSFEEGATQLSQNVINKYSGYKPDIKIMDGVGESMLQGAFMGSAMGGTLQAVAMSQKEKLPSQKEADEKIRGVADRLMNPENLPLVSTSMERVVKWSEMMNRLGRIDEQAYNRIQENVSNYRAATDLLSVGKGKNTTPKPETVTRLMDLLAAKKELTSTKDRAEYYSDEIRRINDEILNVTQNKEVPEGNNREYINQLVNDIVAHTRVGVPSYTIDGVEYAKDKFTEIISGMTANDFKAHKIGVSNDKETSNLLIERSNAIQEPSTEEGMSRSEQPEVGLPKVGEGDTQEQTAPEVLQAKQEEVTAEVATEASPAAETVTAAETITEQEPSVEVTAEPAGTKTTEVVSEAGETAVREVSSKTLEGTKYDLSDVDKSTSTIATLASTAREEKRAFLTERKAELLNTVETAPAENPSTARALEELQSVEKRIESLAIADKIDEVKAKLDVATNAKDKAKWDKENTKLQNRFRELNGNFSYNGYELISHTNRDIVKAKSYKDLAEKYHAAKQDGTNPALVKAVEELAYKGAGIPAPEAVVQTEAPAQETAPVQAETTQVAPAQETAVEAAPAKPAKAAKPAVKSEVEAIEEDIQFYEMKVEDFIEDNKSSLSELKEDIANLKKKKDGVRSSNMTRAEKVEAIEEIDSEIEELRDNYDSVVESNNNDIREHKSELNKLKKKLVKAQLKAKASTTSQTTKANGQENTESASGTNQGAGEGTSKLSRLLETITKKSSVKGGINKRDVRETQRIRGHNVDVVSEITFDNSLTSKIKSVFTKFGGTQKVYEIKNGDSYLELQKKALENNPHKASVTYKTAEDYNGTRMFITEDGSAGLVLTKDGELSAGFSDGTHRNAISQLLILGIKEGAQHIECFDTVLPDIYTKFGFKFKSRTEFNEEFAPEGWDYETYKEFNDGKPDVLFGVYEGGDRNTIEDRIGTFGEYKQEDAKLFDKESYQQAHDYNLTEGVKLNKKEGTFVEPVADEVSRLESMLDEGTQFQLGTEPSKAKDAMIAEAEKLMAEAEDKGLSEKVFDATTPEPQVTQVPIVIKENSKLADKVKRMGLSELIGKKVNFVMADQLKVGTVKAGGKVLNRMGGHFFPLIDKIFGKAAWASMDVTAANRIINGAVKADYTVVYNMKPTAIDSNKAISETFLETIKALPKGDSDVILKQIISHLTGKKFGKNTNRVNDIIANVKTFKAFSDAIDSLNVELKAKILNLIIPSDAVKSTTEIGKSLQKLGLSIETIRSINTEQFVSELPMGAMTMVLEVHDKSGNKVTAKTRGEALITREQQIAEGLPTHDNYPIYVRGKAIAILNETVPFWHMLKGSLNTINVKLADIIKHKDGRGFTSKEALSAEMRSAMMSASSAKSTSAPDATHYQKFVSLLSRSFPTVKVVATEAEFKNLTDRLGAQKLLTKNQKVYGAIHDGNLYLNPSLENYNTPIHEFGHIWTNVVKNARPHLYEKGISLVKGSEYESRVLNSADYKRVTDKMRKNGSSEQEISHYISEEALAMAIGDKGESFVIASHRNRTGFHDWLNKLYTVVKNLTGISKYTPEQLQNITLEEFTKAIAVDLMSGGQLFSNEEVDNAAKKLQLDTAGRSAEAIVKKARENGFSEESIRVVLNKRGYSPAEITEAMSNIAPTATLSEDILEGYDALMKKVDDKIRTQIANKVDVKAIAKYLDKMLAKSEVYNNATDAQKKRLELEVKNKLNVRENRTATLGRFFGAIKDVTGMSNSDKKKIVRSIRDLSQDSAKHITQELRMLAETGKVTLNQVNNIISKFGKTNLNSETSVSHFVDYMSKVFKDAEYSAKLSDANKMMKSIKKLSKNKDKDANLRALASAFIKINPATVDDIDMYNSVAAKINEAIKGSTVRGQNVTFAESVNIAEASEYIRDTIDAQNDKIRKDRIAEIQQLMGVDVSDLSAEDMLEFLSNDEPITKYNEGIVRSTINKMFNIYSTLISESFSTGKDVFTDEDVSFTQEQMELVNKFMSMDLSLLDVRSSLKAVDALSNFLQNKSTAKMQSVVSSYIGEYNARALVRKGVKSRVLRKYYFKNIGRFLTEQTYNLNMVFERMFGGVNSGALVKRLSGMADVINNKALAQRMSSDITKRYVDRFYHRTTNGQPFNSEYNEVERGVYALMTRNVIGTEAEMKAEFIRRKSLIEESIEKLSKGDAHEQSLAALYQRAYDKVAADAKNTSDIYDNTSATNIDAVEYWISEWDSKFDQLSDVSLNVYNSVLNRDFNYTPDKYSKLSSDSGKVELSNDESAFLNNTDGVMYKKESGVLIKANHLPLPKKRYINLSFDTNNSNSMYDALVDINTASAIRQVESFFNSDSYSKIVQSGDDAKLLKNRCILYVQNIRRKSPFSNDEMSAMVRNLNKLATIGVGQALGGITQPLKQVISVGMNTLMNAGRLDVASSFSKSKRDFLNRCGYAIANRGIESQAQVESIDKLIDLAAKSTGEKALKLIEKANKKWLEVFLVNPDVYIARMAWMTYYEKALKMDGVDPKSIDYSTHEVNTKAADYAQEMVDRQQNVSDVDMAGKLFSNKEPSSQILIKTLLPFASFRMNQSARLGTDISVLTSKTSTVEDKIIAGRSVAGFGVEMVVFHALGVGITLTLGSIAKALLGKDEDDEEYAKRKKNIMKGRGSSAVADTFSPIPIADKLVQMAASYALNEAQDLMDVSEEDKLAIYSSNKQDFVQAMGTFGIAYDRAKQLYDLVSLSATGEYKDDFGVEKKITEANQEKLKYFIPAAVMVNMGLAPSETSSVIRYSIKYAKEKSKKVGGESSEGGMTKEDMKTYMPKTYERMYGKNSADAKMKEKIKAQTKPYDDKMKKFDEKIKKLGKKSGL